MLKRCVMVLAFICVGMGPATAALIPLGDDDFSEEALGFTFNFFGTDYTSVFVNSNGSLTFGSGDTDFSESAFDFLFDAPRIAALWDDLSPNQGGSVDGTAGAGMYTVTFTDVPQFLGGDMNSLVITLFASGVIHISYAGINSTDALVGVTPGGGVADPGESDLSTLLGGSILMTGTIYELFFFEPFDLDNETLVFEPTARTRAPEPGTLALLGAGLASLGFGRRRRKD